MGLHFARSAAARAFCSGRTRAELLTAVFCWFFGRAMHLRADSSTIQTTLAALWEWIVSITARSVAATLVRPTIATAGDARGRVVTRTALRRAPAVCIRRVTFARFPVRRRFGP